jgi:sugar lactone lactonase YvrE
MRFARCSGIRLVAFFTVLASAMAVTLLPAATGDTIADHVLGQGDFLHGSANTVDGASLNTPNFVAVDRAGGHLYLSDTANNRVIGWSSLASFVNGEPADFVLGQPDLYGSLKDGNGGPTTSPLNYFGPEGVAVDSQGNLYVADTGNDRVLEYNAPMSTCATFPCTGPPPNAVFGQLGDFFAGGCNFASFTVAASADSLCSPWGLAVDANDNLYVADEANNRVLEYNTPLKVTAVAGSGDTTADLVFGQGATGTDFADVKCNGPTSVVGANFTCMPFAVGVDFSGNVYVSDTNNSRVLEYNNSAPNPTNAAPNLVLGQSTFTGSGCGGATGVTALCSPRQLSFDSSNNLYVADRSDNRVLEYFTPLTVTGVTGSGDKTADLVLGEPDFTSVGHCGFVTPSADATCAPNGVDLDSLGNVYIADTANNRLLIFDTPLSDGGGAKSVLGQGDFSHVSANSVDPTGLWSPGQVAIDRNSVPQHLYVADSFNHRVLGWNDVTSFANDAPADLVLGQPDFETGTPNTGGESLHSLADPTGVALDSNGNLYVSDAANNRALEFNTPFVPCASAFPCVGGSASLVFGLTGTSTASCSGTPSATTLCNPKAIGVDANNNLFVADSTDNRVLGYYTPLSVTATPGSGDTTADIVFGQAGSFATTDCNHPSSTVSASSLCNPDGVASDANGNIYISDLINGRVLEFNETNPPTNVTANTVFGQNGSFSTAGCNSGGRTANSLCNPHQIAFDSAGNVYVADQGNSRTLEFNTPLTATEVPGSGNTTADRSFGQADGFTAGACNFAASPSAATECGPYGVALDNAGDLIVVDNGNNRVLKYDQPLAATATPTPTATATGPTPTATRTATASATPTASATSTSSSTASSTASRTPTPTATATATASQTATQTMTPTATPTQLPIILGHPTSVSFGTGTVVGKTSKPKKISLKNTSSKSSHLSAIIQMETATPPFAVKSQCRKTLAPGKSCKVQVTFTPPNTTPQSGELMIFDNVTGSPQTITLTGTGKPPK